MKLLRNLVLLEPIKPRLHTGGGIILLDKFQDDRMQWRVLAVGPGKRTPNGTVTSPEIHPGDKVLMNPGLGVKATLDNGRVIAEADRIQMVWR